MTIEQDRVSNPFGMDEGCTNCDALSQTRRNVVHGYGDVTAEFLFVRESPDRPADLAGQPLTAAAADDSLRDVLVELGLATSDEEPPVPVNAFVTHLTRCRHPDRPPTDTEIATCEPFLNAEIRSINPEIIVPVGERALRELAAEYTTTDPTTLEAVEAHGVALRGRGFELLPMVEPDALTADRFREFIEAMRETMGRDYRQTKGRQGR